MNTYSIQEAVSSYRTAVSNKYIRPQYISDLKSLSEIEGIEGIISKWTYKYRVVDAPTFLHESGRRSTNVFVHGLVHVETSDIYNSTPQTTNLIKLSSLVEYKAGVIHHALFYFIASEKNKQNESLPYYKTFVTNLNQVDWTKSFLVSCRQVAFMSKYTI
jgi:hypothetical protein